MTLAPRLHRRPLPHHGSLGRGLRSVDCRPVSCEVDSRTYRTLMKARAAGDPKRMVGSGAGVTRNSTYPRNAILPVGTWTPPSLTAQCGWTISPEHAMVVEQPGVWKLVGISDRHSLTQPDGSNRTRRIRRAHQPDCCMEMAGYHVRPYMSKSSPERGPRNPAGQRLLGASIVERRHVGP